MYVLHTVYNIKGINCMVLDYKITYPGVKVHWFNSTAIEDYDRFEHFIIFDLYVSNKIKKCTWSTLNGRLKTDSH